MKKTTNGGKESASDEDAATASTAASTRQLSTAPPSMSAAGGGFLPAETIVVPKLTRGGVPPLPDTNQRAIHRIRLAALTHNFRCVESVASQQRCGVITVVKADGYGHGAIATALHLADGCGADAFAVATLQEGIALRRALENNPPGRWSQNLASHFYTASMTEIVGEAAGGGMGTAASSVNSNTSQATARIMRPARIRILVLGPPVGYPRCFDDYWHHEIEVMVSGPEVALALLEWVANDGERKRTQVERAAMESKQQALLQQPPVVPTQLTTGPPPAQPAGEPTNGGAEPNKAGVVTPPESSSLLRPPPANSSSPQREEAASAEPTQEATRKSLPHPCSTLGNVSGPELAKEVRAILMSQKAATDAANYEKNNAPLSKRSSGEALSSESSVADSNSMAPPAATETAAPAPTNKGPVQIFGGIEAAAKDSRSRQVASERTDHLESAGGSTNQQPPTGAAVSASRKRLRWHALVDSGMGRLGFKTEPPLQIEDNGDDEEDERERDTVEIIKELVDAEIHNHSPIEFYGMCTHMADANSPSSGYTHSQISRFVSLLQRVRAAGIHIPTVSTDNSAALLSTDLTHFNPDEILTQPESGQPTRGYVRTGGAIYGQRPAFTQLKAVSTLLASVRHVAVLKEGESVGYDRAYIATRDVRIATLTVGFADGYPRELGNGVGKVAIRGTLFPVAGNVCMDMLMVELGPAEDRDGEGAKVVVGDVAVLWGPLDEDDDEGLVRLQDLAATLKTTQSALTCGLDKIRVLRQFS